VVGWTDLQTIDYVRQSSGSVVIGGTLSFNDIPDAAVNQTSTWDYEVELREETDRRLGLVARVGIKEGGEGGIKGKEGQGVTHIQLQYHAPERGVKVFGFGAQYTFLNLRGQKVPIWVSEQGVSINATEAFAHTHTICIFVRKSRIVRACPPVPISVNPVLIIGLIIYPFLAISLCPLIHRWVEGCSR
jgi:hypothetical protein